MTLKKILRYAVIGAKAEAQEHDNMSEVYRYVDGDLCLMHQDLANKCLKEASTLLKLFKENTTIEVKSE